MWMWKKKIQEKEDNYELFIHMLQVTYTEYKFPFIPVIVGAMGAIPIDLKSNIKKTWILWKRDCKNDGNDLTEEHYRKCKDL